MEKKIFKEVTLSVYQIEILKCLVALCLNIDDFNSLLKKHSLDVGIPENNIKLLNISLAEIQIILENR